MHFNSSRTFPVTIEARRQAFPQDAEHTRQSIKDLNNFFAVYVPLRKGMDKCNSLASQLALKSMYCWGRKKMMVEKKKMCVCARAAEYNHKAVLSTEDLSFQSYACILKSVPY